MKMNINVFSYEMLPNLSHVNVQLYQCTNDYLISELLCLYNPVDCVIQLTTCNALNDPGHVFHKVIYIQKVIFLKQCLCCQIIDIVWYSAMQ